LERREKQKLTHSVWDKKRDKKVKMGHLIPPFLSSCSLQRLKPLFANLLPPFLNNSPPPYILSKGEKQSMPLPTFDLDFVFYVDFDFFPSINS
jgi:hypothetical protein